MCSPRVSLTVNGRSGLEPYSRDWTDFPTYQNAFLSSYTGISVGAFQNNKM